MQKELTGMLPAVIVKIEALLAAVELLNPVILKGYAGLTIDDFKTFRVNGDLELTEAETEVQHG